MFRISLEYIGSYDNNIVTNYEVFNYSNWLQTTFNHLQITSVIQEYLKPYNWVHVISIR